MLKKIEIWDFESHEHTILDDLSDGLNLICGESNSGKTSIVRALKLVAYNDFDPASVRVGAKKCKVMVESDRGKVTVERGKKVNLWTVEPKGGKKEELRAVGVSVVPQAAEIIGLKMVKLGDVEVPVNIMDQLESHFMLSSVGGDKASGSMRAQIVDEISGLSGIEGVIKDVSLDRHRFGREVKRIEDEMNVTISKLHDEDRIAEDEAVVDEAQKLVDENEECLTLAGEFENTHAEYVSMQDDINNLQGSLKALPDHERAIKAADGVEESLSKAVSADKTHKEAMHVSEEVKVLEDRESELDRIGDPSKYIESCNKALDDAQNASTMHEDYLDSSGEVETREKWLSGIGDPSVAIEKANKTLEKAEKANTLFAESVFEGGLENKLNDDLKDLDKKLVDLESQREKLLSEVKVCPLTLGAVSDECMEKARKVS